MSWRSFNETSTVDAAVSSAGFLSSAVSERSFPIYDYPEDTDADVDGQHGCNVFQFAINTILIGALCIFGIAGNLLSMVILQRDRRNRVAVFLLQSLAIADTSVLIIAFVVLSMFFGLFPMIGHYDTVIQASPVFMQYVNPLGNAVQSCTIWLTVLLAINRYIAVCKPFKAEAWLTMRLAIIQVSLVIFLSFGLNVPRLFMYEYDSPSLELVNTTDNDNKTTSSSNSNSNSRPSHHFSALGQDRVFEIAYLTTFYTTFVLVLPLILLCGFNLMIALRLRASRRKMRLNSLSGTYRGQEESSITVVMIAVVAELVICHLPDRVLMIMRYVMYPDGSAGPTCPDVMAILENIFNMLVIVSSSTNFIIYFALRRRFRDTVHKRLVIACCARCRPDEVNRLRRSSTVESFEVRRRSTSRAGSNASDTRDLSIGCTSRTALLANQIQPSNRIRTCNSNDAERKRVRWQSLCTSGCLEDSVERRPKQTNCNEVNEISAITSNVGTARRKGSVTSHGQLSLYNNRKELSAFNGTATDDHQSSRYNRNCIKAPPDIELCSMEVGAMPRPPATVRGKADDDDDDDNENDAL